MVDFARIYGALSFRPELYVSIDARPRKDGNESTQGGTLPGQILMHFDGETARKRISGGSPFWLDWFFAHEAAHLFQQDKAGGLIGDDEAEWIHEGGVPQLHHPRSADDHQDQKPAPAEEATAKRLCGIGQGGSCRPVNPALVLAELIRKCAWGPSRQSVVPSRGRLRTGGEERVISPTRLRGVPARSGSRRRRSGSGSGEDFPLM